MNQREVRLTNLNKIINQAGSAIEVARKVETPATYISQLKSKCSRNGKLRTLGDKMATRIEIAFNKPVGWMSVDHSDSERALKEIAHIVHSATLDGDLSPKISNLLVPHLNNLGCCHEWYK